MGRVEGLLLLVRPGYTAFACLVAATGIVFARANLSLEDLLPIAVVALHYMAVCVRDDLDDYQVDQASGAVRPLVVKAVSEREAIVVWVLFHLLALPLSFMVNTGFAILMALYIPIGLLYSRVPFRISDRATLGNCFFVMFTVLLPFIAGAMATGRVQGRVLGAAGILWLFVFVVDLTKDYQEKRLVAADKRVSMVSGLGRQNASMVYASLTWLCLMLLPVPYWVFGLDWKYFIPAGVSAVWFVLITQSLLRTGSLHSRFFRITYAFLPIALVCSILLGSMN